jgi:hypothetical protein
VDGKLVKNRLEIASYRGFVTVEVPEKKGKQDKVVGWPWLDIDFSKVGSSLVESSQSRSNSPAGSTEVSKEKEGANPDEGSELPKDGNRLVVCGFGLVDHWDASPSARFFLARLFEELVREQIHSSNESREDEK